MNNPMYFYLLIAKVLFAVFAIVFFVAQLWAINIGIEI